MQGNPFDGFEFLGYVCRGLTTVDTTAKIDLSLRHQPKILIQVKQLYRQLYQLKCLNLKKSKQNCLLILLAHWCGELLTSVKSLGGRPDLTRAALVCFDINMNSAVLPASSLPNALISSFAFSRISSSLRPDAANSSFMMFST